MSRYLTVEDPSGATVDFLTEGVEVSLSIRDGKLHVKAKMSHGETTSTWDIHEVEWKLPEDER